MTVPGLPLRPAPRRRRWPVVLSVLAIVVVAALFVASRVTVAYYSLTPGVAQPVVPLITVPPARSHDTNGSILLTDVSLTRLSALGYLAALLDSNAQIVSAAELLGPDTPADQLAAQGYLEMAQSQSAAKAAAFNHLGYHVSEHDAGALVVAVQPGSPAARAISVAQIVLAVGATPTPDSCALLGALSTHRPGDAVQLSVEQSTVTPNAVIVPGKTVTKTLRLASPPAGVPRAAPTGCPGLSGPPRAYLGVAVETQQDFTYPFPVSIDTRNIGGPSAGLAMTLGLIDKLSGGDLTGGRTVAATGTITADGTVGDVGGVPQKTVAVERGGASVFFVPPSELGAARSKATPQLQVFAVESLDQALSDLRRLGGRVPQKAAPTP